MKQDDRILQALILSQYRYYLAEENKIYCKPVILFKAQKTIAESELNIESFNNLIKNLKLEQIENIKSFSNSQIVKKAINYFENKI
jgi:type III restriction enzyme